MSEQIQQGGAPQNNAPFRCAGELCSAAIPDNRNLFVLDVRLEGWPEYRISFSFDEERSVYSAEEFLLLQGPKKAEVELFPGGTGTLFLSVEGDSAQNCNCSLLPAGMGPAVPSADLLFPELDKQAADLIDVLETKLGREPPRKADNGPAI